jgi:predicted phosphodiesterase
MRLLLTADLHRDPAKLRWLLEEAPAHDAILVAGDLLDIFSDTGFVEQKSQALIWRQSVLISGKSFAWCSGNHDFFHDVNTPMRAASPLWMRETPSSPTSLTDGETRVLKAGGERIAVTTFPWPVHGGNVFVNGSYVSYLDYVDGLLRQGKKLQREGLTWILLCHEPPANTPLSPTRHPKLTSPAG